MRLLKRTKLVAFVAFWYATLVVVTVVGLTVGFVIAAIVGAFVGSFAFVRGTAPSIADAHNKVMAAWRLSWQVGRMDELLEKSK